MPRKLGTFLGVFTPTILTILGVIMYLRFGWLVGHLGLGRVIPIVLIANVITIITTLSFSAVATNVKVGAGGAYHIISRSLGIEIGGAIGLPLFLSQAFSVTLYAYGLAESFRILAPDLPLQPVAVGVILAVGALAFVGSEHALKAQVPLLVLVGFSLIALAVGAVLHSGGSIVLAAPSGKITFWAGFAIFFPAVTGVMAGLGLSGDLKDPGFSLPRGSMLAVVVGLVVYLVVPVLLVMGASQEDLRTDPLVWSRIAILGPYLILPGLWAAIFSSAVGSILGAPRTLQALARDGLAPRFLAHMKGRGNDLIPALITSLLLALAAVFLGDLNTVATVVTMFFLTVYGMVNLVAAFEALSGDPSWRPRLRAPWVINLAGGIACLAVMMLINPLVGLIAIVAELLLWLLISRREHQARWGDARHGLYESLIRWALIKLSDHAVAPRNWRPHLLVFVEDIHTELDLVRFGDWFSQGRGIVTVCKLEVGDLMEIEGSDLVAQKKEIQEVLRAEGLVAFPEVDMARDLVDGIVDVAQANGMGGIASNMVLLGWPDDPGLQVQFLRAMRRLEVINKSLVFGRIKPRLAYKRSGVQRTVDVWWGGLQRNGDLLLLLTYLLTRNPSWRRAQVRILSIATTETMKDHTKMMLGRLLPETRMEAKVEVFIKDQEESVAEVIQRESADAEVVVMGLATPERGNEADYAQRLESLVGDLPLVFFVKNASLFIGELITPEPEDELEDIDSGDDGPANGGES